MQKSYYILVSKPFPTYIRDHQYLSLIHISELFINNQLPAKEEFLQAMRVENYTVNQLQLQSQIARQQLRIDPSGYLPDIAVFGKQTLYAHGIQSNLVPRTIVGAVSYTHLITVAPSRWARMMAAATPLRRNS